MKRRERTRHLIELGGLVIKSGLVELTKDDRTALYGAFLELALNLQSENREQIIALWLQRGNRAFRSEAEAKEEAVGERQWKTPRDSVAANQLSPIHNGIRKNTHCRRSDPAEFSVSQTQSRLMLRITAARLAALTGSGKRTGAWDRIDGAIWQKTQEWREEALVGRQHSYQAPTHEAYHLYAVNRRHRYAPTANAPRGPLKTGKHQHHIDESQPNSHGITTCLNPKESYGCEPSSNALASVVQQFTAK